MDHVREELKQSTKERQQTEWEDRESRRLPDRDEDRDARAKRKHQDRLLPGISKIPEYNELDMYLVNMEKTLAKCGISDNEHTDFVQLKLTGKHAK